MKRVQMMTVVAGSMVLAGLMVGCEEKKAPATTTEVMKGATDAANKAADVAKDTAKDAAKAAEKAADATTDAAKAVEW